MHGIATARPFPSRAAASHSKQADVCIAQDVRRYRELNAVNTFRCRTSLPRNVVHCRSDESHGERLPYRPGARSLALPTKVRYAV